MNAQAAAFIEQLTVYDYLLFGGSILLFLLLLILAILLRDRLAPALFCIIIACAVIILTPTLGYRALRGYLFSHEITLTELKPLEFTDALLVCGSLINRSKYDFEHCTITAKAYQVTGNPLMDLFAPLDPIGEGTLFQETIPRGERSEFKIFIEPFSYTKEYNVSIGAACR